MMAELDAYEGAPESPSGSNCAPMSTLLHGQRGLNGHAHARLAPEASSSHATTSGRGTAAAGMDADVRDDATGSYSPVFHDASPPFMLDGPLRLDEGAELAHSQSESLPQEGRDNYEGGGPLSPSKAAATAVAADSVSSRSFSEASISASALGEDMPLVLKGPYTDLELTRPQLRASASASHTDEDIPGGTLKSPALLPAASAESSSSSSNRPREPQIPASPSLVQPHLAQEATHFPIPSVLPAVQPAERIPDTLAASTGGLIHDATTLTTRDDSVTGMAIPDGLARGVVSPLIEPSLPNGTGLPPKGPHQGGLSEWARDHPSAADPAFQVPEYEETPSLARQLWREITGEGVDSSGREGAPGAAASDPKRERVYNTMFHVPWRVELLIQLGYFVCLDSFLTLFTILPLRLLMLLHRLPAMLIMQRRLRPEELNDLSRALVLLVGFGVLQYADVSLIYHWIRGQSVIKLVVVFNVMEVLDKLCQTLGADVVQMLFTMSRSVTHCPRQRLAMESLTLLVDQGIALLTFATHSLVLLCHAVTLNVAINSHNNMLLTILISNNFAEVKGNVFKRFSKENVHKLASQDTVERFHLSCHLLFVAVQNIVKGQGASLQFFFKNIGMVWLCEIVVDCLKHSFLAKFNEIKPEAYSEFQQTLCRSILEHRSHHVHRTLVFVPLAPACFVARTLATLLALLPAHPPWLKHSLGGCIILVAFLVLLGVKAVVGISLRGYSRWYLLRSLVRKDSEGHLHAD